MSMMPVNCPVCRTSIVPRTIDRINYLYKDNELKISNGNCGKCGSQFFYIEKSRTLYETVFPLENYGFCKPLKNIRNIYTSYVPIASLVDEYKDKILSLKTKDDIVIGFDGWEDIIIDKRLAGGWYMTYNSPPVLDVAIINCRTYCFGVPEVYMAYFPTPILDGTVKIIDDRTVDFFEEKRNVMLEEKRSFYIGIKEIINE